MYGVGSEVYVGGFSNERSRRPSPLIVVPCPTCAIPATSRSWHLPRWTASTQPRMRESEQLVGVTPSLQGKKATSAHKLRKCGKRRTHLHSRRMQVMCQPTCARCVPLPNGQMPNNTHPQFQSANPSPVGLTARCLVCADVTPSNAAPPEAAGRSGRGGVQVLFGGEVWTGKMGVDTRCCGLVEGASLPTRPHTHPTEPPLGFGGFFSLPCSGGGHALHMVRCFTVCMVRIPCFAKSRTDSMLCRSYG